MDAFDDSSDALQEETQVSQLLQHILSGNDSFNKSKQNQESFVDSLHVSNDFSDSALSSDRNPESAPRYHFHGLAATQTQTQYCDQDEQEGSQNENVDVRSRLSSTAFLEARLASPDTSPLRPGTTAPHVEQVKLAPYSTSEKPPSQSKQIVSFQSPRIATPPHTRREEALTASVQAGARAEPKKHNLTTQHTQRELVASGHFDSSLSDIERASSPADDLDASNMFAYPSNTRNIPSSPVSQDLVDATPSFLDSSQSQGNVSQQSELSEQLQSQDLEPYPQGQRQETTVDIPVPVDENSQESTQAYDSTEPSSSYARFVNGEATQPAEGLQATQLFDTEDSQDVDDPYSTIDRHGRYQQWPAGRPGYGPTTSSAATSNVPPTMASGNTNILRMVQGKEWRALRFMSNATAATNAASVNATRQVSSEVATQQETQPVDAALQETQPVAHTLQETQPVASALQETQIMDDVNVSENTSRTRSFPPRRPIGHPPSPPPSPPNAALPVCSIPTEQNASDTMDVVPDSEPLQPDPTPSTSVPDSTTAATSAVRTIPPPPPRTPSNSLVAHSKPPGDTSEIVPDSMAIDEDEKTSSVGKGDSGVNEERQLLSEENEDEEDDVPLAAATHKRSRQPPRIGRYNKRTASPSDDDMSEGTAMPPPSKVPKPGKNARNKKIVPAKKPKIDQTRSLPLRKKQGQSVELAEVPSSHPEQDHKKPLTQGYTKVKTARSSGAQTRPVTRGQHAQKRRNYYESSDNDDAGPSSSDELLLPEAARDDDDDDDETELVDDEYIKYEDDTAPGPSRKRKRVGTNLKSTRTESKMSIKGGTPSERPIKRLRQGTSSTSRSSVEPATRVFALWKPDSYYYPGTVHSHKQHDRYLVKFDDGTEDTVTLDNMRIYELRIGDGVFTQFSTRTCKVVDVSKFESEELVTVDVDGEHKELASRKIRIACKTVVHVWTDRKVTAESIVTIVKPPRAIPLVSPSRSSVASGASAKGRSKLFAKTGLVVTSPNSTKEWDKEKDRLMLAIKNSGGTVIDDWSCLVNLDGRHSNYNRRWAMRQEDAGWTEREGIERVFLLADDANQKPKYLIALALGVPCLSINWLYDCVSSGEEKDWAAYLLPQGYSESRQARVSQFVDMDWGRSEEHLKHIMENSCTSKPFSDKSVLCLGSELVPAPKRKHATGTRDSSRAVPGIVLSMGAALVEAANDIRSASAAPSTFDYVVVPESAKYGSDLADCQVVTVSWVKECLISGRLLETPLRPSN